jgi:hypothetical protein
MYDFAIVFHLRLGENVANKRVGGTLATIMGKFNARKNLRQARNHEQIILQAELIYNRKVTT